MSKKRTDEAELKTAAVDTAAVESETTEAAEGAENKEAETVSESVEALVYCGPSIKNIVREGTVFTGGLPEALVEYTKKQPAIKNLIVSLEKYAALRAAISAPGTAAYIIYKNILSTVKEGR